LKATKWLGFPNPNWKSDQALTAEYSKTDPALKAWVHAHASPQHLVNPEALGSRKPGYY